MLRAPAKTVVSSDKNRREDLANRASITRGKNFSIEARICANLKKLYRPIYKIIEKITVSCNQNHKRTERPARLSVGNHLDTNAPTFFR